MAIIKNPATIIKSGGTTIYVNNIAQSALNFTSDPQTQLDNKVETVEGKGLSTNDYTTDEKNKLAGIETGAQVNKPIDSEFSTTSENSLQNKTITQKFNNLFNEIYPIGSIYISTNNTSPASLFGGTWEALLEGYTLWTTTTSGQGGQIIEAGLPNIEGGIGNVYNASGSSGVSGSIIQKSNTTSGLAPADAAIGTYRDYLDASAGNSIYGNSDTVQPPAIKVYMWKRVP